MPKSPGFDRKKALTKAMICFWSHGFADTSMRALEAAMGLKASSIYNSFTSKEALFEECLAHYVDTVVQARLKRLEDAPCLRKGLKDYIVGVRQERRNGRHTGCFLSNSHREATHHRATTQELIRHTQSHVDDALAKAVMRAQQKGEIAPSVSAQRFARQLSLLTTGAMTRHHQLDDTAWLAETEAALEDLIDLKSVRH